MARSLARTLGSFVSSRNEIVTQQVCAASSFVPWGAGILIAALIGPTPSRCSSLHIFKPS